MKLPGNVCSGHCSTQTYCKRKCRAGNSCHDWRQHSKFYDINFYTFVNFIIEHQKRFSLKGLIQKDIFTLKIIYQKQPSSFGHKSSISSYSWLCYIVTSLIKGAVHDVINRRHLIPFVLPQLYSCPIILYQNCNQYQEDIFNRFTTSSGNMNKISLVFTKYCNRIWRLLERDQAHPFTTCFLEADSNL